MRPDCGVLTQGPTGVTGPIAQQGPATGDRAEAEGMATLSALIAGVTP